MKMIQNELEDGLKTAYIDSSWNSNLAYRPEFVSNDYKTGKKVLSSIEDELRRCDEFSISVAFITSSGITPLLQVLEELEQRKIPGRILTTDYLMFTEPEALKKLNSLSNIEVKMFCTQGEREGFHTKGYIFREEDVYRIIIGSSNMTGSAITVNREWNTKLISTKDGAISKEIISEYSSFWNSEKAKPITEIIDEYETKYKLIKEQKRIAKAQVVTDIQQYRLEPNKMQIEFVRNVIELRNSGENCALLLSATGTGKTYAAAFALREFQSRRTLFLVHREQIAKKSMESFARVLGSRKSFGVLSGNTKDYEADYLFSTIQTMSRDENLSRFDPSAFDTIIVDEVHRAGANTYLKIMEYFKPDFLLGMTASPERTDGFDIYQLFNHNIAYEIRLQQALEEDMLCPFHYFGITEVEIDGEIVDDSSKLKQFAMLTSDTRVDYIIQKAKYYGHSGNRVKGLVFCSRKTEARELSIKFNKRGFRTTFLSGDDSQEQRELAIERLTDDSREDCIDYIFTVDIFNEGVDIPEINQVIMLRPTESPIVFVQQLGRGLRKAEDKEYVVILDFIGNYNNNYMIPIALSGDRTYNKDNIRRYVREGERVIPGASTIHFDEIAKKKIFESIDNSTLSLKFMKEKYNELKNKLGKIPTILEFYEYGEIDPMILISYSRTYHNFLMKADKGYTVKYNEKQVLMLEFISALLVNGKRLHELIILKSLMDKTEIDKNEIIHKLKCENVTFREADYKSAISVLNKEFLNEPNEKRRYQEIEFISIQDTEHKFFEVVSRYQDEINKKLFCQEMRRLIDFGIQRFRDYFAQQDDDNLVLYQKYSRKDVCRILNWEKDSSSTMYGYRIKNNTCPIFVTYKKQEDISTSTKYKDEFINNKMFSWMTRNKVRESSREAQMLNNYKENGLKIYLFIKKSDGEGSDFYYMGRVTPINWKQTIILNDLGKQLPIMNYQMELEHAVRTDIYDYFIR